MESLLPTDALTSHQDCCEIGGNRAWWTEFCIMCFEFPKKTLLFESWNSHRQVNIALFHRQTWRLFFRVRAGQMLIAHSRFARRLLGFFHRIFVGNNAFPVVLKAKHKCKFGCMKSSGNCQLYASYVDTLQPMYGLVDDRIWNTVLYCTVLPIWRGGTWWWKDKISALQHKKGRLIQGKR